MTEEETQSISTNDATATVMTSLKFPKQLVDSHHHFVDTDTNGDTFQKFLKSCMGGKNVTYVQEQYNQDIVQPLQEKHNIEFVGSVHVEAMPDNGVEEAKWVTTLTNDASSNNSSTVKAIVASCDLTLPTVEQDLQTLTQASSLIKGIRWILDYGKNDQDPATHIATTRHASKKDNNDGTKCGDYLRGYHGTFLPEFERGFQCLADHNLTFDLQCAPEQLPQAAALCMLHPDVKVVIDHLGKPRTATTIKKKDDNDDDEKSGSFEFVKEELECWRTNMKEIATLPNVYCKISMLGYITPGWIGMPLEQQQVLKDLVVEVINMFTPQRCMVGLNWYLDAAVSDSDGLSENGPSPSEYIEKCMWFFEGLSEEDCQRLFCDTAREFYGF